MTFLLRSRFMASSVAATFLSGMLVCSAPVPSAAQAAIAASPTLETRIQTQRTDLQQHPTGLARVIASRWALLAAEYSEAADFPHAEDAFNHAIQLLAQSPADAALYADTLDQFGALYRIYNRLPEALNCRRKALAIRQQAGSAPLAIARSQSHLAELSLMSKKYKEAFNDSNDAYQTMASLSSAHTPDREEQQDLLSALIVRAYAQCGLHHRAPCLADAKQALALSRQAFPAQSQPVGAALVAVGSAQLKNGSADQAADAFVQALQIFKTQLAPGDPRVIFAMQQYRDSLETLHRAQEALAVSTQISAFSHQPQQPCPYCTVSVFGLRSTQP